MKNLRDTILIVDDVKMNRELLAEIFRKDYQIQEAENGAVALEFLERQGERVCAVLLDVIMPVMDGMGLIEKLASSGFLKKVPVFLVTSEASDQLTCRAYELGVADVVNKPVVPHIVRRRVDSMVELYQNREQLGEKVVVQAQQLNDQEEAIQRLNRGMVEALAAAIEFRDCESGEHVRRIYSLTQMLLERTSVGAGLSRQEIQNIATAAIMHDVGKIAIPDFILNKPDRLTQQEFEIMKTHTLRGCELLEQIPQIREEPVYRYAYDICRHHHERWDGNGYPDGLKGDKISVWAQVVSLADVYDALTNERIYKKAFSHQQAVQMICGGECGVFNPKLTAAFLELSDVIEQEFRDKRDLKPVHSSMDLRNSLQFMMQQWEENLSRMPGGFLIYEADGEEKILYVNEKIRDIYHCQSEEEFRALVGNSFRGMVHPEDLEYVEKEIAAQISGGSSYDFVEYRIVDKEGGIHYITDYGKLVVTVKGERFFYVFLADENELLQLRRQKRCVDPEV